MDYRTELMKTQCPVMSKGPNDPPTGPHIGRWQSGLVPFGLNRESWRRTNQGSIKVLVLLHRWEITMQSSALWNPVIRFRDCSLI